MGLCVGVVFRAGTEEWLTTGLVSFREVCVSDELGDRAAGCSYGGQRGCTSVSVHRVCVCACMHVCSMSVTRMIYIVPTLSGRGAL